MAELTRNATQLFFQNSLAEVVRKLRASTRAHDDAALEQFIQDTKKEVSSPVQAVKVAAIQKAVYFHMLGYSAAYAHFPIVEVMADTTFANKRIAYVAACAVFAEDTDVLPLLTALLRRDLASVNQYEVGLALYCIASVCTPSMARELVADVVALLSHPRTAVRKRAVLSLYKLFLQYPESLRPVYPRLKAKIEDAHEHTDRDAAVRGAVVCVLCELAKRNPANFLGLAVPFYALLSSVHSNWTFIKLVKVFGYFAPLEPRLGKKLVEPLTRLLTTTSAKSVQYECLLAVANGMSQVPALTRLAAAQLRHFVTDADQNLKFLGLEAMLRLARHHRHLQQQQQQPSSSASMRREGSSSGSSNVDEANALTLLQQHYDVIVQCLDDGDVTIRCKALALLRELVTRDTLVQTVNHILDRCLLQQQPQQQQQPPQQQSSSWGGGAVATVPSLTSSAADEVWHNRVIATTLSMTQSDDYALMDDFDWYVGVLVDVALLHTGTYYAHGAAVEGEFVSLLARVPEVRPCGVEQAVRLLTELQPRIVEDAQAQQPQHGGSNNSSSCVAGGDRRRGEDGRSSSTQWRVLCAAAFVCGEYAQWLPDKAATCARLLDARTVAVLPADVQVSYVTAVGKIAAYVCAPCARQLCMGSAEDKAAKGNDDDDKADNSSGTATAAAAAGTVAALPHDPVTYEELLHIILPPDTSTAHNNNDDDTGVEGSNSNSNSDDDDDEDNDDGSGATTRRRSSHAGLRAFCRSAHAAVQERASIVYWQLTHATPALVSLLYAKELSPVAAGAQAAVPLPADVDMTTPFCDDVDALLPVSDSDDDGDEDDKRQRRSGGDASDDDGSGADEDDNDLVAAALGRSFSSSYAAAQQRHAEKARRAAMAAFYLRADNDTTTTTSSSQDTASAPDASPHSNNNNNSADGSKRAVTSLSLRHSKRDERVARAYTLRKEVHAPEDVGTTTADAAAAAEQRDSNTTPAKATTRPRGHAGPLDDAYRDSDDDDEDEATRRLRGIDVTRALQPDEKLPVRQPYAAPGNSGNIGGGRFAAMHARDGRLSCAGADNNSHNNKATSSSSSGGSAARGEVLCETSTLRLVCYVDGCRWDKEGVTLSCTLHIANLSRDAALQDVYMTVDRRNGDNDDDDDNNDDVALLATLRRAADGRVATRNDKDSGDDVNRHRPAAAEASRVCVAARVSPEALERCALTLHLRRLPASLLSSPVPLTLSYTRETVTAAHHRRRRAAAAAATVTPQQAQLVQSLTLPLRYVHFAKRPSTTAARMTAARYHDEVLSSALRDAALVSAFVPCAKARVQAAVAQLQQTLYLQPIDVLRDAMSLYGVVHTRRSLLATHPHVAMLLRETVDGDGTRGVHVYVRAHYGALAEALLHDALQLFRHEAELDEHNNDD